jgi:hypothetical protein
VVQQLVVQQLVAQQLVAQQLVEQLAQAVQVLVMGQVGQV